MPQQELIDKIAQKQSNHFRSIIGSLAEIIYELDKTKKKTNAISSRLKKTDVVINTLARGQEKSQDQLGRVAGIFGVGTPLKELKKSPLGKFISKEIERSVSKALNASGGSPSGGGNSLFGNIAGGAGATAGGKAALAGLKTLLAGLGGLGGGITAAALAPVALLGGAALHMQNKKASMTAEEYRKHFVEQAQIQMDNARADGSGIDAAQMTLDYHTREYENKLAQEKARKSPLGPDAMKDGWSKKQEYADLSSFKDRGSRNVNPGNVKGSNYLGQVGKDEKNHAIFATKEAGVAGIVDRLYRYNQDKVKGDDLSGLKTIRQIMYKYAPPSDGNNTEQYIAEISRKLGIDANQQIDFRKNPELLKPFVQEIMRKESPGRKAYSEAEVDKGIEIGKDSALLGKAASGEKHREFLTAKDSPTRKAAEEFVAGSTSKLNDALFAETKSREGRVKYLLGGKDPNEGGGGIDCSGWAQEAMKRAGAPDNVVKMMMHRDAANQVIGTGKATGTLKDVGYNLADSGLKEGMLVGARNNASRAGQIGHIGIVVRNPETGELGISHSSGKGVNWQPVASFQKYFGKNGFFTSDPMAASRELEQAEKKEESLQAEKEKLQKDIAAIGEKNDTAVAEALSGKPSDDKPASTSDAERKAQAEVNKLAEDAKALATMPGQEESKPALQAKATPEENTLEDLYKERQSKEKERIERSRARLSERDKEMENVYSAAEIARVAKIWKADEQALAASNPQRALTDEAGSRGENTGPTFYEFLKEIQKNPREPNWGKHNQENTLKAEYREYLAAKGQVEPASALPITDRSAPQQAMQEDKGQDVLTASSGSPGIKPATRSPLSGSPAEKPISGKNQTAEAPQQAPIVINPPAPVPQQRGSITAGKSLPTRVDSQAVLAFQMDPNTPMYP